MNVVNTNKEENKYLTYEEVKEKAESYSDDYPHYGFITSIADSSHSAAIRTRKSIDSWCNDGKGYLKPVIWDLEKIPEEHRKLLKDYTNLFDRVNLNRYRLLSRLLYIYQTEVGWGKDVYEFKPQSDVFTVTNNMKIERLNDTFNIFKSLKYPNEVLDDMFSYEYGEQPWGGRMNVFRIILNEDIFYSYLSGSEYLFNYSEIEKEYDKKTKQLLKDFFPNVNTGR